MENDPRVTRVGRWLRRTSIDEIPQLINVLKGEMSLVGPRPFLESELAADPDMFEWRMDFLPGITGLWQVAGRSWLPVEEGLRMDLAYLEHWSLRLDLLILARTAGVALTGNRRASIVSAPSGASLERSRYLSLVEGDDLLPATAPCEVSVVVVTHDSVADIGACLTSLRAARHESMLEVIVVENASNDGTAELVAERFPEVRLIRKTLRSGFSTNCNIGASAASGKYVLLLNPDTVVRTGTLRALVDYLDRHADVAAVGPRLVYPDGRPQPSARRFPTVKAVVVRRSPARVLLRNSGVERAHLMLEEHSTERDADWLLGAAILMRADALHELGGLDERYRLYCEDIDLCWRLHRAGWRVRYYPEAVVVHALAETTRKHFFTVKTWWHLRSMARFVRLHGLRIRRLDMPTEGVDTVVPEPVLDLKLPQGLTRLTAADT
jgi:GT2 family glycosyltransferase